MELSQIVVPLEEATEDDGQISKKQPSAMLKTMREITKILILTKIQIYYDSNNNNK